MKYLVMCEGTNEETLVNVLLDNNFLKITRDDLLGQRIFPIKTLNHPAVKDLIKTYNKLITIYRTGDTQRDNFKIPKDLSDFVSKK